MGGTAGYRPVQAPKVPVGRVRKKHRDPPVGRERGRAGVWGPLPKKILKT